MTAVVRDKKGKVVRSLEPKDFTVAEDGQARKIVSLQADTNHRPASRSWWTAAAACASAKRSNLPAASPTGFSTLDQKRDDASLFSFDTRLLTLRQFTGSVEHVRAGLKELNAWGATSIYDAIAGASAIVTDRAPTTTPSSFLPTAPTTGAPTRRRKWRGSRARSTCPCTIRRG